MDVLFPHETIRKIQDDFIDDICTSLKEKKHLLAHAPTGLGKSAAVLATTIPFAIKNDLNVFFLTSRHTQHKIAVETIKKIKEKHNPEIIVADIIGKRHMCLMPGTETLSSHQFSEYCREQIENKTCPYYNNVRNGMKLSFETRGMLKKLKDNIMDVDELIVEAKHCKLCPYEIGSLQAKAANVVIMDYFHIFSPAVSPMFLKKTEKTLSESIIVVDEAHNLPSRMREHFSIRITNTILDRAIKEAQPYPETKNFLEQIKDRVLELVEDVVEERMVKKEEFNFENYDEMIEILENVVEEVKDVKQKSYISSVVNFLTMWKGQDEGFARIVSKRKIENKTFMALSYLCLDPSLSSTEVIDTAYSVICMSGTLIPLEMYSDLLGFKNPMVKVYQNPFPKKNRLNIIVPKTSTKFTKRSMGMYQDIAKECASYVNVIPGNSIIFFTSYVLKDSIDVYFRNLCKKTTYYEQRGISKDDKDTLLENFKRDKEKGSVLMGVLGGSFSEGIDLSGDLLKGVVIVGLPLSRPDLETTELINYFDKKFAKGWDYGYTFPAMQKTIQAAGRCIRSETDKGVIIFLDERYSWNSYFKCFPPDFNLQTTMLPVKKIEEFFKNQSDVSKIS